jgi:hypothetical protein
MIIKAILKLNPTAEVSVSGNDINTIVWENGTLLSATDYLALSDNTMTEEARTYRQALRDITEGLTTKEQVEAVVFPTKF